ncbi:MAG: TetR/AcrR family transcriptional regulator [Acidobacteria bacterium]|nr:TetR/AcrR family transcriptional regulator [Acidobacteriota bacterium]
MSDALPTELPSDLASALELALVAGASSPSGEADGVDGRRLRAERGRSAVLAAALDLVDSGNPAPTIAEIAASSGISERTIFRYFPDRDALFIALVFEVIPRIAALLSFDRPSGTLETRVRSLVAQRIEFVRVAGPLARSVETLSPHSPVAAMMLQLRRTRLRDQVVAWLGPELAADDTERITVIDALLSRPVIESLLADLDEATLRALTDSIIRIVG